MRTVLAKGTEYTKVSKQIPGIQTLSMRALFWYYCDQHTAQNYSLIILCSITLRSFIRNDGQASALNVAYIFKVFRTQKCLMVAQSFDLLLLICVCEECNNLHNSKSIFMITDFKFLNNVFEAAEFWCIVGLITILRLLQRENFTFLYL